MTNVVYRPTGGRGGETYAVSKLMPITDGLGKYRLEYEGVQETFFKETAIYGEGDVYGMLADEIHSIKFSRNAVVLFFEGPAMREGTHILEPVVDGDRLPTFRCEPWMFKEAH